MNLITHWTKLMPKISQHLATKKEIIKDSDIQIKNAIKLSESKYLKKATKDIEEVILQTAVITEMEKIKYQYIEGFKIAIGLIAFIGIPISLVVAYYTSLVLGLITFLLTIICGGALAFFSTIEDAERRSIRYLEGLLAKWYRDISEAESYVNKARYLYGSEEAKDINSISLLEEITSLYQKSLGLLHDDEIILEQKKIKLELERRKIYKLHFTNARELYDQNRSEEALEQAQKASEAIDTPQILSFIDQCKVKIRNEKYNFHLKNTKNFVKNSDYEKALSEAQKAQTYISNDEIKLIISQCKESIKRQNFQRHYDYAERSIAELQYKKALEEANKAIKFIDNDDIKKIIEICDQNIRRQDLFEEILKSSSQLATQGDFKHAIAQLERALIFYPREDGKLKLASYKQEALFDEYFLSGLKAELDNQWSEAISFYERAIKLKNNATDCRIRLAAVKIKNSQPNEAISILADLTIPQAVYLRGYVHYVCGNLEDAISCWLEVNSDSDIDIHIGHIRKIIERNKLSLIQDINSCVENDDLNRAKELSLDFISKHGYYQSVKKNLDEYINPKITHDLWKSDAAKKIISFCTDEWGKKKNLESLHNLATAVFYQAKHNPEHVSNLIPLISSCITNLRDDPSLKTIPWVSDSIDYSLVAKGLRDLLENLVLSIQDNKPNKYLEFRDLLRWQFVALDLSIKTSIPIPTNDCSVKLLPSLYLQFKVNRKNKIFPNSPAGILLESLYSPWGKSIAAFMDNDPARGVAIKINRSPISEFEHFAVKIQSYYEGSYYLSIGQYKKGTELLKAAKPAIDLNSGWKSELDETFDLNIKEASSISLKIELAQAWYELINSKMSKTTLVECKSSQIAQKIDDKSLSLKNALQDLKKLKSIDSSNPILNDLIERVEMGIEFDDISNLIQRNPEQAVRKAKSSKYPKIKFVVAEIFIDIAINAANQNAEPSIVRQLGRYAFELCPNEPSFQKIFVDLGFKLSIY